MRLGERIKGFFKRIGGGIKRGLKKVGKFVRSKFIPGWQKVRGKVVDVAEKIPVIGKIAGPVARAADQLSTKIEDKILKKARERHGEE